MQNQLEMMAQDLQQSQEEMDSLSRQLKISESSRSAMEATLDSAQENVAEMQKDVQV